MIVKEPESGIRVRPKTLCSPRATIANDGIGQLHKPQVVACVQFVSNFEPSEQVVPAIGALHDPTPCTLSTAWR